MEGSLIRYHASAGSCLEGPQVSKIRVDKASGKDAYSKHELHRCRNMF